MYFSSQSQLVFESSWDENRLKNNETAKRNWLKQNFRIDYLRTSESIQTEWIDLIKRRRESIRIDSNRIKKPVLVTTTFCINCLYYITPSGTILHQPVFCTCSIFWAALISCIWAAELSGADIVARIPCTNCGMVVSAMSWKIKNYTLKLYKLSLVI